MSDATSLSPMYAILGPRKDLVKKENRNNV